ncbi:hypothetical protein AC579_3 [Pseudocercospora musae]|uniref:Uncharacterized protein n=1 Tax=Pseudocercospora musae TaxID=113226 RepID=A0A139I8H3_9PEZI|nr:hypothetical protein AC579_3 [Pseudocercospora musae]
MLMISSITLTISPRLLSFAISLYFATTSLATSWHITSLTSSCESLSSCKYSFTVIGNSIPRYPGFQASCSALITPGDTTFRACQIETTSDTLRAGGVSGVKSVEGYVKLEEGGGNGDVSVRVEFDVGGGKIEVWEGGKMVEKEELEGGKRGFDVDVKMVETEPV